MTRGAVNREKERERSSYLGGEGGGLVMRQENSFLVGAEAIKMDETGKVRTAKVIIGFVFGINLTPSQNLGKLFFFE